MIQTIVYFFVYLSEQIVAYILNNKYGRKISLHFVILCYICSGIIQYAVRFIGHPNWNSLFFIILNFLVALICFNLNIRQSSVETFFDYFTPILKCTKHPATFALSQLCRQSRSPLW